jgi:ATP-dependent helicase HrpB
MSSLPIDALLPDLRRTLADVPNAVLQAPPGAGKTTRVPLALLDADWLGDRKIVLLEPRRLAARSAARFMARSRAEAVGETIGYRVRMDSKVGSRTRVEVVTEGVLTRMLQRDPMLESVALVVFDEFHERSLQADLALALCLDVQSELRHDLRLLVMSATLDGAAVARLLGDAPVLTSHGQSYPVATRYRPVPVSFAREPRAFCAAVAQTVRVALQEHSGSLLVFLPGESEIRRVERALRDGPLAAGVIVAPLYGRLTAHAQDSAIRPAPAGRRKVVLATAIAETSLTIEGIRVVIDAGLARAPRFDPGSGLTRLDTLPVSSAAADQRRGRAGRLEAGACYRLWSEHRHLHPHSAPEILDADLAPLLLELANWGVTDALQLRWLDPPPAGHLAQARDLLVQLGALDASARITAHGRALLEYGVHPRLAHMMLCGRQLGLGELACELAALLAERDPLARAVAGDADMVLRLEWLRGGGAQAHAAPALRSQIRAMAQQWQRQLDSGQVQSGRAGSSAVGPLLAFAYPDRIAQRRASADNRFLMSNGRGARFGDAQPLAAQDYIVAAQLGGGREARIFLAAAVRLEQLLEIHAALVSEHRFVEWNPVEQAVRARRQQRLGELVLADHTWQDPDPAEVAAALLHGIARSGSGCLPWGQSSRLLQARIEFMRRLEPRDWPDVSDTALMSSLEQWLPAWLEGMNRLAHLKRLDLRALLTARLSWDQQRRLDEQAPTHVEVPSGSRRRLDYSQDPPVLAVRLQEMFGVATTPCIAGGRVTLLLHLLSPARRPVQITADLAAFWRGAYNEVKKELKGRYPKHHWPDDPLQAVPTAGTRRKR